MKTIRNSVFMLFLLALAFSACKKEKEQITCNLMATPDSTRASMAVVYTATQTGDGTMSSLSYATSTGMVTVNNPSLPWTLTVQAPPNTKITMTATGTVTNGSITIDYLGTGGGYTIHASDNCTHYSD